MAEAAAYSPSSGLLLRLVAHSVVQVSWKELPDGSRAAATCPAAAKPALRQADEYPSAIAASDALDAVRRDAKAAALLRVGNQQGEGAERSVDRARAVPEQGALLTPPLSLAVPLLREVSVPYTPDVGLFAALSS
jgi:hypothetical protein